MFATPVTKRRPGYANFAIADPPLKLVLLEGREGAGGLDHIGVETLSGDEQSAFHARLDEAGLTERVEGAQRVLLRLPGQGVGERPRRAGLGGLPRPR